MRTRSQTAARHFSCSNSPSSSSFYTARSSIPRRRRRASLSSSSDDDEPDQDSSAIHRRPFIDNHANHLAQEPAIKHTPLNPSGHSTHFTSPILNRSCPPTLLNLPDELLIQIVELLVDYKIVHVSTSCDCSHKTQRAKPSGRANSRRSRLQSSFWPPDANNVDDHQPSCLPLLSVCRRLYTVARTVIYHRTVFQPVFYAEAINPVIPCSRYNRLSLRSRDAVHSVRLSFELATLLNSKRTVIERLRTTNEMFPNLYELQIEVEWSSGALNTQRIGLPEHMSPTPAESLVHDVLVDSIIPVCCRRLVVVAAFGRIEHQWAFDMTVVTAADSGVLRRKKAKSSLHQANSSSKQKTINKFQASSSCALPDDSSCKPPDRWSYIDHRNAKSQKAKATMYKQLSVLLRWIKVMAEREVQMMHKRNVIPEHELEILMRVSADQSVEYASTKALLELVHSTHERSDWW